MPGSLLSFCKYKETYTKNTKKNDKIPVNWQNSCPLLWICIARGVPPSPFVNNKKTHTKTHTKKTNNKISQNSQTSFIFFLFLNCVILCKFSYQVFHSMFCSLCSLLDVDLRNEKAIWFVIDLMRKQRKESRIIHGTLIIE